MNTEMKAHIEQLDEIKDTLFRLKRSFIEKQIKTFSYNLTPTKYSVLKLIFTKQRSKVAEVSQTMAMTSGATTTLLNQLEEDKLILRVRDEKDRRIVWITLSEEGQNLISAIVERSNQFWAEMLSTLSKEEQIEYLRLLNKISAKLEID
jgi:DNA-binding MarR family transcriptional regulator